MPEKKCVLFNFSAELSEAEISSFIENQTCVVFMCGDKTKVPHQLGFQRFDLFFYCDCYRHQLSLRIPYKDLNLLLNLISAHLLVGRSLNIS